MNADWSDSEESVGQVDCCFTDCYGRIFSVLSTKDLPLSKAFPQNPPKCSRVAVPRVDLRCSRSVLADTATQLRLPEVLQEACQRHRVIGIAQGKTIYAVSDDLRAAVVHASNDREPAGHSFQRRQSEGVLTAGADVN